MSQTVRVRHLLIKHQESRNPISRRTNESTTGKTKAQAHAELEQIRATLTVDNVADWRYKGSDCGSFQDGAFSTPVARARVLGARRAAVA